MKKLLALGYMVVLPLVSSAKILPSIVAILLYSVTPAGLFVTLGIPFAATPTIALSAAWFSYFVAGFFPAPAISNWIMGL